MIDVNSLDIRWMDKGACLAHPDLPWTDDSWTLPEFVVADVTARMAGVCSTCPVLTKCAGMAAGMTGGFWAGRERAAKKHGRTVYIQPVLDAKDGDAA